ncbi:hypothetical protein [Oryza sativa Japonica Group]|uniref:Uncharacterized protein n=1 Tax=Oryza sativa subsp. japonica TaxID=39947 RepID=Q5N9Z9_ORYSJ|nr:hypothetical protein [Oryza sativa Japonica Group]
MRRNQQDERRSPAPCSRSPGWIGIGSAEATATARAAAAASGGVDGERGEILVESPCFAPLIPGLPAVLLPTVM